MSNGRSFPATLPDRQNPAPCLRLVNSPLTLKNRSRNILPERESIFSPRRCRSKPKLIDLARFQNTEEKNPQHLLDQSEQRQIPLCLVPRVDPVHHAEKRKGRH